MVLNQDTNKSLQRAQDGTVQQYRVFLAVVFGDVFRPQTHRQVEIQLQRTALPDPTEAIFQRKFDLRPIEGALARLQFVLKLQRIQGRSHREFGLVPLFIAPDSLLRARRQLDQHVRKAEVGVHFLQETNERDRLVLNLLLGTENVRIILYKVAHAHDAVQRTGRLVPVTGTEFGHAQRQVAIAFQALIEDFDVTRTVHRLDRVITLFRLRRKHHVRIHSPVPGLLPQRAVNDLGGLDLLVAFFADRAAQILLNLLPQRPALRVPEHHARRLFLNMKEVKLTAKLAMIALFGLF